jgi:hypothetical protein
MEIKALGSHSALIKGKKEIILINPSEDFLKKDKSSRIVVFTDKSFDGVGLMDEKVLIRGAGEYELVKQHVFDAFYILRKRHLFVAYCAAIHHMMYKKGYGLKITDFPKWMSLTTIKKILEVSSMISIADYIDANNYRKTKIKDGSGRTGKSLKKRLYDKFPDDKLVVDIALEVNRW